MSVSALGSPPATLAPVSLPTENEAAERVPDNEKAEAPRISLKEGTGTKIDVSV